MDDELKGLDDIFGQNQETNEKEKNAIVELPIDSLVDYRKGNIGSNRYSQGDMEDLISSIKENGVLVPTTVRPIDYNQYEVILGHHRKDASVAAGLEYLPCIIKEMNDDQVLFVILSDAVIFKLNNAVFSHNN